MPKIDWPPPEPMISFTKCMSKSEAVDIKMRTIGFTGREYGVREKKSNTVKCLRTDERLRVLDALQVKRIQQCIRLFTLPRHQGFVNKIQKKRA